MQNFLLSGEEQRCKTCKGVHTELYTNLTGIYFNISMFCIVRDLLLFDPYFVNSAIYIDSYIPILVSACCSVITLYHHCIWLYGADSPWLSWTRLIQCKICIFGLWQFRKNIFFFSCNLKDCTIRYMPMPIFALHAEHQQRYMFLL